MERKRFYDSLRPMLGPLSAGNVAGFELCLNEAERRKTALGSLAYILATAWWESAKTMAPVEEGFYLGAKAKAFQRKLRYWPYYGRGLVQLTWKENYEKVGKFYGLDLVNHPERALNPKLSTQILFDGMEKGWFTGKKVSDFVDVLDEKDDEDLREYIAARRVVNGTDRAAEIGKLTLAFESALKLAGYDHDGRAASGPVARPIPPVTVPATDVPMPEKSPDPIQSQKARMTKFTLALIVTVIVVAAIIIAIS
jgi:putative chitinase